MSTAHNQKTDTGSLDQQENSQDKLKLLIKGLLKNHKFLNEYRLQNLVYLAELLYLERTEGQSLSGATYTPYRFGSYSKEVTDTIESLSNEVNITREQSACSNDIYTYRYIGPNSNPSDKIADLVSIVMSLSRHKSSNDLKEWVKSTYLFENTNYNEEMRLPTYVNQHLAKGNQPEWKKLI